MSQTNQFWCQPGPQAAERKGSVIEASSHTQPTAILVKTNQRKQHRIQCPGRSLQALAERRLRYAKPVGLQFNAIEIGAENQLSGMNRVQYGQVKLHAFAPGNVHIQMRVDFAIVGQVDGYVARTVQLRVFQQVERKVFGGLLLFLERQCLPLLP